MAGSAVKVVFQGPDGPVEQYLDLDTGELLEDLSHYNIEGTVDADQIPGADKDPYGNPIGTKYDEDTDLEKTKKNLKLLKESNGPQENMHPENAPDAANNFGYFSKPTKAIKAGGILRAMAPPGSSLLGAAGMFMGGFDKVLSIQNNIAVNKARDFLGLEPKNVLQQAGGFIKDPRGYVGDVTVNGNTTAVGLDALDSRGRSPLTPNEARMRAMVQGTDLREATPEEKKQNIADFKVDKKTPYGMGQEATPLDLTTDREKGPYMEQTAEGLVGKFDGTSRRPRPDALITSVTDGIKNGVKTAGNSILAGLGLATNKDNQVVDIHQVPLDYDTLEPFHKSDPNLVQPGPVSYGEVDGLKTRGAMPNGAQGLVVHHTGGLGGPEGVVNTLNERGLGVQNIMDRQGNVFETVPEDTIQSHIKPDNVLGTGLSNKNTIGIEVVSPDNQHVTPEQIQAGVSFINDEISKNPDIGYNVYGHGEINNHKRADEGMAIVNAYRAMRDDPLNRPAVPTPRPDMMVADVQPHTVNTTPVTNGGFLSAPPGFANMNDDERKNLATTLAGEIDPRHTDLTTDEGKREAFGILSSVENRVGKYGSVQSVLDAPNQYSTWNNATAANTAKKNYSLNPGLYDSLVKDYTTNPANNLGFTSYHANYVNPGWSAQMENKTTIGQHTFGFLSEYSTKANNGVQPHTVFNTSASLNPAQAALNHGVMSDENANRNSSLASTSSSQPATSQSTSPSANASGTGTHSEGSSSRSSNSSGGFASRDTNTSSSSASRVGGVANSGYSGASRSTAGKTSSSSSSRNAAGGLSGYSGSRSDGWS